MILKIGNKKFCYKKDALLHYKSILNSYNFDETLNDKDFTDLLGLIEYDKTLKLIANKPISYEESKIINIKIARVQFNTKCFEVIYENDKKKHLSYIYIINRPKITQESSFKIACRNIIQKDLFNVKKKYFDIHSKKGLVKCQETSILSKWEDLVVDHRQPNTFSMIIERFLELNKLELESIDFFVDENNFLLLKDMRLSIKFRNYHKEKASLRIVRKEKNLSRIGMARIKGSSRDLSVE